MKKLNKALIFSLVLIMVLAASITVYAFTVRTPAEIIADLTGKGTEEVAEIRYESGKTYGEIAYEAGEDTWEKFRGEMLENRRALLDQRAKEGILTQEEADEILENIEVMQENCPGTGGGYGMGRGFGMMRIKLGNGNGFGSSGGNRGIGFGAGRYGRGSW